MWRASKIKTFEGSDLLVFKPGNTSPRLAGWESDKVVYVAELYSAHDKYEDKLTGRNRRNYHQRDFIPFEFPRDVEEESFDVSELNQALNLIRKLEVEKKSLKADLDTAMAMAEKRDDASGRVAALAQQVQQLQAEATKLRHQSEAAPTHAAEFEGQGQRQETQADERETWGLWRRLNWALWRR